MAALKNVVMVDYLRSPFSRSRPNKPERDVFNDVYMVDVAAKLIKELIKRTGINPEEIGDVLSGCTMQQAEQFLLGGRIINMLAELPMNVPAQGSERVCCSGMSAMHQGAMEIELGYSDIVVAGGLEHMTHLPLQPEYNPHMSVATTVLGEPYMSKYDMMTAMSMGLTAEKLYAECKDWMTKEDMDKWGVRAHNLAEKAIDEGYFKGEIMPVEGTLPDGAKKMIDVDQAVRRGATLEATANLPLAFNPEGFITAGNSSPLNAGAAYMILMSKEKAKECGLDPMANIVSLGWAGVDPSVMGKGPVPASKMALKHAGLEVKDIDFWEINEAFTVVALYAIKMLGLNPDTVNMKGGATAIGHPLAASGPRLTGTLARILEMEDAKYGAATLCGGGGQGATTILERV
ncbi:MAG: acetyl-CoA acetyltransferase [Candidatus Methanolliviera sp. GoM_oil]|nr:MAG: acetyl-CoA acetyltransferase [Candidatus Methanolliviera sp. GoM_oil]